MATETACELLVRATPRGPSAKAVHSPLQRPRNPRPSPLTLVRRQLPHRSLERLQQNISVAIAERHRRPDLHNVVIGSVRPQQHTPLAHPIGDEARLGARRLERLTISHELHAKKQARTPYVADDWIAFDERT